MKANRTEKILFFLITLLLSVTFWGVIICSAISTIEVIILVSLIFVCISYIYSYVLIRDIKKMIITGTIFILITYVIAFLIHLIKNAII